MKSLIEKAGNFIRRARWKAHFLEKGNSSETNVNSQNFGFKSNLSPPQNKHLTAFENDLYGMIRTIEFKPVNSPFLNKLKEDVKRDKEV